MLDLLFQGVYSTTAAFQAREFLLCLIGAIVIGIMIACFYMYRSKYTKSFVITLALLPAIVCVVIMMVNGNIGAGVAVAGTFSLVRFRSVPGTAKEICAIFLAMAAGLAAGMGYIGFGLLFVLIICICNLLLTRTSFGEMKENCLEKTIRITIPEELDYQEVFIGLFAEYTDKHQLVCVKTTNMGSLFKLTYHVTLKDEKMEKEFIDKIRCRNGNLEITSSIQDTTVVEL